jgi:REP element-mobilizing transposase RayT
MPLHPGQYYHIYNRGNNRENLFVEDRNYRYFLQLYTKHIAPIAETYAYCLLRNHFHFLVRIKDEEHLTGLEGGAGVRGVEPSQAFSNLFNAYARAYNRACGRTGALFQRPFGRKQITSDAYFTQVVIYIHQNPQKHKFVDDFRDWPYSSYQAHLSAKPTLLKRAEVIAWFGEVDGFASAHSREMDENSIVALVPEDFD